MCSKRHQIPYGVFVCLADEGRAYIRCRELSLEGDIDPRQLLSGAGAPGAARAGAAAARSQVMNSSVLNVRMDAWLSPIPPYLILV